MSKFQINDPLLLAGKVITIFMQGAMAIAAVILAILIPVMLFAQDKIDAEIQAEMGSKVGEFPVLAVVGLFLLAIVAVAIVFVFFGKLRAIISTVGEGDPFAPINADRLSMMAWLLLALQVLMVPLAGLGLFLAKWADKIENSNVTVDAGLDLTGILMVIVLFILARVFRHGAAMREDLEGTV